MRKLLTCIMCTLLLITSLPYRNRVKAEGGMIYLPEDETLSEVLNELSEDSHFYFATSGAYIPENGTDGIMEYAIRLSRTGDSETSASVTVNIADFNGRYGEDYTISLLGGERASEDENMTSFTDLMQGEVETTMVAKDGQFEQDIANDEELRQEFANAVNEAVELIEEVSGAEILEEDEQFTLNDVEETIEEIVSEADDDGITVDEAISDETFTDETVREENAETVIVEEFSKIVAEETVENTKEEDKKEYILTEAVENDESEIIFSDPLRQEFYETTGITAERQEVTVNENNTADQIQQIADFINSVTVGAKLDVEFAEGETDKYIVITAKNNDTPNGDRYFYLTLTEPEGASASGQSTCAVTILDDEEVPANEVSFFVDEESEDSITIAVTRSGCLNQITHVKLQTTGGGSAMMSRDYSPVDVDVVIPFNVSETQVTIPVRREYLSADSTFELSLTAVANAEVKEDTLEVVIRKELDAGVMLLADGEDFPVVSGGIRIPRGLNTILVDEDACNDIKNKKDFVYKFHSNNYDGVNRFEGEGYRMYWKRDSFFSSDWTGKVLMAADVGGSSLFYSGARVNVAKGGTCFKYTVGFGNEDQARRSGSSIATEAGMARVYSSTDSIPRKDVDYLSPLPPEKSSLYIKFENFGGCSDCNSLWIYDMSPIYRWYQMSAVNAGAESFVGADGAEHSSENAPLFLHEDGHYYEDEKAGKMSFVGAINETPNQICTFVNDTLTLVHNQDLTTYDPFVYLKQIKTSTGTSVATFDNGPSNAYSFSFSAGLMYNSLKYQGFDSNGKAVDGDYDIYFKFNDVDKVYYGYGDFNTIMGYKSVSVVVNKQRDFGEDLGKLVLSSTEVEQGTYDNVYHKGDTLYATYRISPEYAEDFEFVGVEVRAKINRTDMDYLDTLFISADENGGVYIDQNQDNRLHYEYYEITPVLSYKNNAIVLRVRLSDLNKFDTTYGIFADASRAYISIDENGVIYRQYLLRGVTARKIYSIPVKMNSENYTPIWKIADSASTYGGEVLYYEAGKNRNENTIYLSASSDIQKFTLDGQISRYSYNSQTSSVERNLFPFEGAMVVMGPSSALTNENGEFSLTGTVSRNAVARYLVSYNGKTEIRDVNVRTDFAADNFILNPENGTILSHLNVDVANKGATGSVITLNNGIAEIRIDDGGGFIYRKTIETSDGFEEVNATERLQKVTAVIRDANGAERFTQVAEYREAQEGMPEGYYVSLAHSQIAPGDRLYLKVTSDRTPSGLLPYDENGDPIPEEELNKLSVTNYHEIYSGYSFAASGIIEIPAKQKFDFMPDIKFEELPIIGGVGFYMAFPFVHVNVEVRDGEYLMSIGVSVMDIVDQAKKTHINQYASGQIYGEMFKEGADGLIDGWKKGLSNSKGLISTMRKAAKEGIDTSSALGGTTWRFDVAVGAYMKFTLLDVQRQDMAYRKDFCLTGVGGYVGVTGGFRWTVYGIIPVVFIPWYFGVQVEAMVNAFFGASVDPNKVSNPVVTFDDAGEETVDMGGFDFFDSSVKALVTGQIFVGAGICGVLGARGGGTVKIMALWEPSGRADHDSFGGLVVFSAGFWFDLFVFTLPLQYSFPNLRFGLVKQLGQDVSSADVNDSYAAASDDEDQGFVFREYNDSSDAAKWIPSGSEIEDTYPEVGAGLNPVVELTLEEYPYEHPDSKLLNLSDGSIALLYLDKNSENCGSGNSALYASELRISIYDPEKGWSDPIAVQGDGTSDFDATMTEMKEENGKIRILTAWASTSPEKTNSITTVKQYLSKLEIYAAEIVITKTDDRNPEIEINVIQLTESDGNLSNSQPVVLYDKESGIYAVFYVVTSLASDRDTLTLANPYVNGSMVKYIAVNGNLSPDDEGYIKTGFLNKELYNGEEMILPAVVDMVGVDLNNSFIPSDIANGGLAVLAYTVDMDSSNDTSGDKEIYIQLYDFANNSVSNPIALTDDRCFGGLPDTLPEFVKSSYKDGSDVKEEVKLFWFRNEKAIAYTSISDLLRFGIEKKDGEYVIREDYRKGNNDAYNGDVSPSEAIEYDDIVHESLERICSYVAPEGTSEADLKMMSNFIVGSSGIEGEDIYVVWTQVPPSEDGISDSVELYITAIQSDENRNVNSGDDVMNDPHIEGNHLENKSDSLSFWSKPFRLTRNSADPDDPTVMRVIDEPAFVISADGNATAVFNEYRQQLMLEEEYANEPVQITEMKLKYIGMVPAGSVDVEEIKISNMSPMEGEEVEITVTLENTGITNAEGYEVSVAVKDRNGNLITVLRDKTSDEVIRPGGMVSEKVTWTASENVEGIYFEASAREISYSETSSLESERLSSSAELQLEKISLIEDENGTGIIVTVTNNGNHSSGNDDFFTMTLTGPYSITSALKTGDLKADDLMIVKESLAGIKPGETITKTIYPGFDKNMLEKYGYIETYACAEKLTVITDENGQNRTVSEEYGSGKSFTIRPNVPTEFKLNGKELPSKIEMQLNDSMDLNVETSPVESDSVRFISGDSDVVIIKDGKLVAVGTGTAQITGYTLPQGTVFGPISVTVKPANRTDDNGGGSSYGSGSQSGDNETAVTPVNPAVNRNPSSLTKEGELTFTEIAIRDMDGNIIEGLMLRVVDKDGDTIDSWTTTASAHVIEGLKIGETYTLEIVKAPESMIFDAREVSFTVTGEKLNIELIGGHTRVYIHLEEGTAATLTDRYGRCVANWIAEKDAYYTEELSSGEYMVNSSMIIVEATVDEQHFYIREDGNVTTEKSGSWWIYVTAAAAAIIIIVVVKKKKDEDEDK